MSISQQYADDNLPIDEMNSRDPNNENNYTEEAVFRKQLEWIGIGTYFCFNNHGDVRYYCKKTNVESVANTRDVFMERNLYRDEINSPNDPTKIEHDFAEFEREVSLIVKSKLLSEDKIILNMEEDNRLRLFFALMGFRSERVRTNFETGLCKNSKDLYSRYQRDGNFLDF